MKFTYSIFLYLTITVCAVSKEPTPRQQLQNKLETLNASLKPLREKAYHEEEVIAALKEVDEAFRRYYKVLRQKMKELSPEQADRIERMLEIRQQLYGEHSGSRAEDYLNQSPKK